MAFGIFNRDTTLSRRPGPFVALRPGASRADVRLVDHPQDRDTEFPTSGFRALAEWRYQIRRFLAFSEKAARSAGIEPQQHQLLLAIKGLPAGLLPTVGILAERMVVRPHTIVELVDRLALSGLIKRLPSKTDRRVVLLLLTSRAESTLRILCAEHRAQLEVAGPTLGRAIASVLATELPPPVSAHPEPRADANGDTHVLFVDDEPRVLQGLRLNLESRYRVSTATSGAEALALCAADPPGVVVSDLRMPGMDGTAFLSVVRDRAPHAVRILLTGQADLEAAIAAINQSRVFRLLTKPCRTELLIDTLEAARREHRTPSPCTTSS
jgi:CheY-like chemotaxis protein